MKNLIYFLYDIKRAIHCFLILTLPAKYYKGRNPLSSFLFIKKYTWKQIRQYTAYCIQNNINPNSKL